MKERQAIDCLKSYTTTYDEVVEVGSIVKEG